MPTSTPGSSTAAAATRTTNSAATGNARPAKAAPSISAIVTAGNSAASTKKGRQLGDKASEWVRVEAEMKSVNRIIPFDALLRPGEYLAAAYPAFAWINELC